MKRFFLKIQSVFKLHRIGYSYIYLRILHEDDLESLVSREAWRTREMHSTSTPLTTRRKDRTGRISAGRRSCLGGVHICLFLGLGDVLLVPNPLISKPIVYLMTRTYVFCIQVHNVIELRFLKKFY